MFKKHRIIKLKLTGLSLIILSFSGAANAQSGRKSNQKGAPQNQKEERQDDKKDEKRGEIRPVKIIRKPKPAVDVFDRCFRNEGFSYVQTVLRVTFDASAKITDVELLTPSGCQEFDEESVAAAREIKFEPAVQDDKPISVSKMIVYQGGIR